MASTPQGNFAAYKELKYRQQDEDRSVDFINLGIDRLIKEGNARDAVKLKEAQDKGDNFYDAVKDIKIEPKQTAAMFQDFYNGQFNKTFDSTAYAKQISRDLSIPENKRSEAVERAKQDFKDYEIMGTFLGNPVQLKLFTDKLNTDTSKIWRGDESLAIMTAIKNNAFTIGPNKNNQTVFKYLDPNTNQTVEKTLSGTTQSVTNPYTEELVSKAGGLKDQMRQEATNMSVKTTNGVGGNRTTESLVFNPKKAQRSFDIRFGEYNLNNDDAYLKQFSYNILDNKPISSKEDWDKVKEAYIDQMGTFVKEEKSVEDKYTAAQLQGQSLDNANAKKNLYKTDNSNSSSAPTAFTSTLDNGNSYVQIRDNSGNVKGVQNWNINSVSLPKVKNAPTSDNTFGFSTFRNKKGENVNYWLMGAPSKGGRIIYSSIPEKDFGEYVSKLGYNPIIVKQALQSQESKTNLYRNSMIKNSDYNNTVINFKAKEISADEDSKENNSNGGGISLSTKVANKYGNKK